MEFVMHTYKGIKVVSINTRLRALRKKKYISISIVDIQWEERLLRIRNAKTFRERLVPIQSEMKKQLKKYIVVRGSLDSAALLVSIDGKPITRKGIQQRIRIYVEKSKIKGYSV
ncbi:tyrosine-type recombinase/integrase [Peribacillus sp. NPDC097198]|uniref:tyrosine-type recombinase/integrase n=1 Tax=Peribacillus sp. NPDC097198 TaxID=3364397 RepID=UPI0037FC5637